MPHEDRRTSGSGGVLDLARRAGPAGAVAWSTTFAGVHLFWAAGGSVGLSSSAGSVLARQRPTWFVVLGLLGVGLALLTASALVIPLASHRLPGPLRAWVGRLLVVAGVLMVLRGIAVEAALITDLGGLRTRVGPGQAFWSIILWNPWFVLGGVLFVVTGRSARPPRPCG